MSSKYVAYSSSEHPALHRDRVSFGALMFGIFAPPIMWAGNLMVTYGLVSHSCYPDFYPLERQLPGFGFVHPLVFTFYLLTLVVCAIAFSVALRSYARTGGEHEGHVHHLMEKGAGRSAYFAVIGMAYAVLFFIVTLVGAFATEMVPICQQ